MAEAHFRHFKPERVLIPETEKGEAAPEGTQVIFDAHGQVAFSGARSDADAWVRSRQDEGANIDVHEGGVLLPGMTDTHYHPAVYGSFELMNSFDASDIRSVTELQRRVRMQREQQLEAGVNVDEPIVVLNYDSSLLGKFEDLDLNALEGSHAVFVLDRSFHSGAGNDVAMKQLQRYLEEQYPHKKTRSGNFDFPGYLRGKEFSEAFVFLMADFAESFHTVAEVQEMIEQNVEGYLARGVTAIHEMEVTSWNQLMAYLLFKKQWGESQPGIEFPVRRMFLDVRMIDRLSRDSDQLVQSGLLTDDVLEIMGVKLLADGSIGSETALMSEPYLSDQEQAKRGIIYTRMKEMERALKQAARFGINKVATHAIGDAAIQRALEFGRRWQDIAASRNIDPQFRIEHFELPMGDAVRQTAELGAWVSMQPNFGMEDVVYHDRIGGRTRMLCPHADMVNEGVPFMFGSDGMPASMLYVVWSAMHHHDPKHRLDLLSAVTAASAAVGQYEGTGAGTLQPGSKTDIVVANPGLLAALENGRTAREYYEDSQRPAAQRTVDVRSTVGDLEQHVQKVIRSGQVVHQA